MIHKISNKLKCDKCYGKKNDQKKTKISSTWKAGSRLWYKMKG